MQATRWDMKPPSYTPEGWGAYGQGYADGHREARTEAFAAIRRAAEVAREREAQGDDLWDRGFPHFAHPQYNKARDIRRAIRAAIGSDKT